MSRRSPPLARTAAVALAAAALAGCASGRQPGRPIDRLSPDSLRAVERAVRLARPAYATQEEAIRQGIYRIVVPPVAPPVPPAAAPSPTAPVLPAEPDPVRPRSGRYVIQISAFRDRASAELSREEAQRLLPGMPSVIDPSDGLFRVVLVGWPTAEEAARELPRVKALFPSAWVRQAAVP